jgi:AcrR family transcriptional regulator
VRGEPWDDLLARRGSRILEGEVLRLRTPGQVRQNGLEHRQATGCGVSIGVPASMDQASRMNSVCVQASGEAENPAGSPLTGGQLRSTVHQRQGRSTAGTVTVTLARRRGRRTEMTSTADQSRADGTRARLLDSAVAAFAERGFHGTTTRDIAAAAGMSPAAVYVHHKSKEELLYQISRGGHEQTLRVVRTAIASDPDPAHQLCAVVRALAVHHARAHTIARVVNYEFAALSGKHLAEIRQLRRAITGEIRALVERGVQAGVFDTPDPAMATTALVSLGIDIARWYRPEGAWSPEEIADSYADLALRMMGASPVA